MLRRTPIIFAAALVGIATFGWAEPVWAQDADEADTTESDSDDTAASDEDPDDETIDVTEPQQPLAVPAPTPSPGTVPDGEAPTGVRPAPGTVSTGVRPAPPPISPVHPKPEADPDPPQPYIHVDAGYRFVWLGQVNAPTRGTDTDGPPWPQLIHGQVSGLFNKNIMASVNYEMAANPARGAFPFVLEARVGWWDNVFGESERRGPFHTLPGVSMTYVGWRWIHDHYRGSGGEWAGTSDAGGLVLGYTRAAPFGRLTVITDSQFSLYLAGWKNRSEFPLGLLNQRLSVGWDPIFVDARFKTDPGTGTELSVGLSFQSILGTKRTAGPKAD